jgi:hypothetical protein
VDEGDFRTPDCSAGAVVAAIAGWAATTLNRRPVQV